MIGRLGYASQPADVGKFRCFVYEKSPDGQFIQMGQSSEESCNGLLSPQDAPKTIRLIPRSPASSTGNAQSRWCQFPAYIRRQSENWLSVDNSLVYMFNTNSSKYQVQETREGNIIEEATCLQQYIVPVPSNANLLQQQQQQSRMQPTQLSSTRRYPASSSPSSNTGSSFYNQIASNTNNNLDQTTTRSTSAASSSNSIINDIVYLIQITKGW